ncbi:hypothetical protein JHK87_052566 [Glycine soja]|nr:hypothetical protein JHK87_052566 [Glycine soja]
MSKKNSYLLGHQMLRNEYEMKESCCSILNLIGEQSTFSHWTKNRRQARWQAETKFGHSAPLYHPEAAGPMIRGDTLRLSAPFCHPEAAGPMASRDQVWSFCTLVSSRGGGPDDTRRYLTVIRTLLSSRGGGPDDKQRPSLVILHPCIIQRRRAR